MHSGIAHERCAHFQHGKKKKIKGLKETTHGYKKNECSSLLLTIVNLVMKMYRYGMLSAETEVRNGIVAAMHASRCNVIC